MAQTRPTTDRVRLWQWLLPALCVLSMIGVAWTNVLLFGTGSRPEFGYWDAVTIPSGQPFVAEIVHTTPGGAAERAGIRDGDRIDVRDLGIYDRVALLFQPVTSVPVTLVVLRGGEKRAIAVTGRTVYDGNVALKVAVAGIHAVAEWWILGCALLLALRRWQTREGRSVPRAGGFCGSDVAHPDRDGKRERHAACTLLLARWMCASSRCAVACRAGAVVRRKVAAASFARWRSLRAGCAGARTIRRCDHRVDECIDRSGAVCLRELARGRHTDGAGGGARSCRRGREHTAAKSGTRRVAAVAASFRTAAQYTSLDLATSASTWLGYMALFLLAGTAALAGAAAVTYALLRRRVLDIDFIVSRTLAVAILSALVVGSFALLEWLLGTVLAGVSHATGWIANAALALVLGLSLNPMHKRADAFIDFVFFRKRHEDERALLDFSKESAYVTDAQVLLDQTLDKLRRHTDARDAAILMESAGTYAVVRSYGGVTAPAVDENDPAVLALKAWHRSLDPHRYAGALCGALALPMVARGRLLGAIVLGERIGGEAYAPDEIEALSQFAHGVGSSLDALALHRDDSVAALREAMASMAEAIAALGNETAALSGSKRIDTRMAKEKVAVVDSAGDRLGRLDGDRVHRFGRRRAGRRCDRRVSVARNAARRAIRRYAAHRGSIVRARFQPRTALRDQRFAEPASGARVCGRARTVARMGRRSGTSPRVGGVRPA